MCLAAVGLSKFRLAFCFRCMVGEKEVASIV